MTERICLVTSVAKIGHFFCKAFSRTWEKESYNDFQRTCHHPSLHRNRQHFSSQEIVPYKAKICRTLLATCDSYPMFLYVSELAYGWLHWMPSASELEKSPFFLGGVALCSWPKSCTTSFITSSVRTTEKVWLAISDFFFHQFHHHPPFRNGSVFKARCHFHDHMVFSGSTAQKNSSAFRANIYLSEHSALLVLLA